RSAASSPSALPRTCSGQSALASSCWQPPPLRDSWEAVLFCAPIHKTMWPFNKSRRGQRPHNAENSQSVEEQFRRRLERANELVPFDGRDDPFHAVFPRFIDLVNKPGARTLEIGSRNVTGEVRRSVFDQCDYVGFDILEGENVD